ncbi:MAG: lipopolysaccharide biosynthesis protein [Bryobacterales bacterium]|nr:lipopolysaccharide biosynthesis protein [Bryobacterales bacterium]
MQDLTQKTIRGGFAKICSQAANFGLRIGSLMVLGRLLDPKDFGLVGMVTAVIGVLNLFKDFGLSTATIQRKTISGEQLSTLFWVNMLVGGVLGLLSLLLAPAIAAFYHEPRLVWVTSVLAVSFLFNAAGVQHSALLQRQMRFTAAAVIEIIALVVSIAIGIGMAFAGYKYWAIVGMTVASPLVSTIGVWMATAWVPGPPAKRTELRSMMRFGGTLTLNVLVVYVAYNLEKILLGRFWGASALGIYGRAYQLISIPTDNLNSAAGGVAFSALSRVQDDPSRFRKYFLKGYSLVLGMTIPVTIACALFAGDLIPVILGPKWHEAIPIFRLLAPTILIFAMINPLAWLLFALGMVGRSLKVALVLAPLVIAGYLIGLSHGPKGVAFAYSTVMTLWALPHIAWCVHGTVISFRDILATVSRPLISGLVAAGLAFVVQFSYGHLLSPLLRLLLGGSLLLSVYLGMLLYVMGEKDLYLDLFAKLMKRSPTEENAPVSV